MLFRSNATSILDYIFRELAVSYLSRSDLAHVDPMEVVHGTGLGSSDEDLDSDAHHAPVVQKFVSKGLVRGIVSRGGVSLAGRGGDSAMPAISTASVANMQHDAATASLYVERTGGRDGGAMTGMMTQGALALKPSTQPVPMTDTELHQPLLDRLAGLRDEARATVSDLRAQARIRGYEGEDCRECGNFTLVRNGTCLKCDTCGGTSGCS